MAADDQINIRLPAGLRAAAMAYAAEHGTTLSTMIRAALAEIVGATEPAPTTLSDEKLKAIARAVADAVRPTASP